MPLPEGCHGPGEALPGKVGPGAQPSQPLCSQGPGQPLDLQALEPGPQPGHARHPEPPQHHPAPREHPQGGPGAPRPGPLCVGACVWAGPGVGSLGTHTTPSAGLAAGKGCVTVRMRWGSPWSGLRQMRLTSECPRPGSRWGAPDRGAAVTQGTGAASGAFIVRHGAPGRKPRNTNPQP